MKLVIMTKSTYFVEEDKILAALFEHGMEYMHLSKEESSPMYAERLLSLLPDDCYDKITVHDHYYLKEEYGLAGIHLDRPDMPVPEGYRGKRGRSCSDLRLLREVKKNANYVFLHNVFDGISDCGSKATFSMRQLEDASDAGLIDKKVFAMGGMSLGNVRVARELGFGGVVVRGDLWNMFDIHSQSDYEAILSHFDKIRKAIS